MKIAIIGAGHIGLNIGGRLIEAGADVTFVGRTRMQEHLRRHGLKINKKKGSPKLSGKELWSRLQ